jgi:hypothetical protein
MREKPADLRCNTTTEDGFDGAIKEDVAERNGTQEDPEEGAKQVHVSIVSKKSSYTISRDSYTAVIQNAQNWSVHRLYTTTKPSIAPTLKAIKSREPRGTKKSKPIQLSVPKNSKNARVVIPEGR